MSALTAPPTKMKSAGFGEFSVINCQMDKEKGASGAYGDVDILNGELLTSFKNSSPVFLRSFLRHACAIVELLNPKFSWYFVRNRKPIRWWWFNCREEHGNKRNNCFNYRDFTIWNVRIPIFCKKIRLKKETNRLIFFVGKIFNFFTIWGCKNVRLCQYDKCAP